MIGLLRKDLFVADKSGRLLLVFAVVFCVFPVPHLESLGNTYAMLLAFMLPLNSIAYDERCKWDRYAAMLPCRPAQIVWGKYLLSYIYTLLAETVILAGALLRSLRWPETIDWREIFATSIVLLLVMLLITALSLPALYRFGAEKGRLVMFVILGAGMGAALALLKVFVGDIQLPVLPMPVLLAVVAAALVGATVLSFRLSVRFYKNRQNGRYD